MNRKELDKHTTQFDCSDVTWEIEESKRKDVVKIILRTDTSFNLIKIWLALKYMCEKIDTQMGFMENADEDVKQ